jgi:hypothetical protein
MGRHEALHSRNAPFAPLATFEAFGKQCHADATEKKKKRQYAFRMRSQSGVRLAAWVVAALST